MHFHSGSCKCNFTLNKKKQKTGGWKSQQKEMPSQYLRLDSLIPKTNRKLSPIKGQADIFPHASMTLTFVMSNMPPAASRAVSGIFYPLSHLLFFPFPPECVINHSCVSECRFSCSLGVFIQPCRTISTQTHTYPHSCAISL